MEKLDQMKNFIVDKGDALTEKARDLTQIAKWKVQIHSCEEVIRKNYLEIGRLVFEEYEDWKDNGEEADEDCPEAACKRRYTKQCKAIENAKRAIEDLEKKINELK